MDFRYKLFGNFRKAAVVGRASDNNKVGDESSVEAMVATDIWQEKTQIGKYELVERGFEEDSALCIHKREVKVAPA